MAASLVGEAKVRVVPSFNDFHGKVKRHLESQQVKFDVNVRAQTQQATDEMIAWRLHQETNAVKIPIKTDLKDLKKNLSEVTHIFERNSMVEAVRLNVKVIGLDALPALALAAASAASGLDALGKSALMLPAALSAAGATIGTLALGLSGVGDAFKAFGKDAEDSASKLSKAQQVEKDYTRAKRDMVSAIRDQKRELEDLNAELRRSSLNEADAILNVQESANTLKEGKFNSITEFQRAQIRYLRDLDGLSDVRKKNIRLLSDTQDANAKGIEGSDRVTDAVDRVSKALDTMNNQSLSEVDKAMAKLSPNAKKFVESARGMKGAWTDLQQSVQDNLFVGLDAKVSELGANVLPGLKIGLSKIATGLNGEVSALMDSVGSTDNRGFLDRILGNTAGGLEQLKRGIDPLVSGFLRLSDVGSQFLPRIGDAFAKVFGDFDNWTKKIAEDGSLRRWIDQGLDALTMFGDTAKNVVSIISSVALAFNKSTGTEGGFIGTMQRKSEELAAYLKSGEGQSSLVGYFNQARDLIRSIRDAFDDIKPFLKDVIDGARTWSVVLLNVGGAFANTAMWIERNTGLLKPLLLLYLAVKTARPIIEGLTGAWKNYSKVVGSVAKVDPTGSFIRANDGLGKFKQNISGVTTSVSNFNSKIKNTPQLLSATQTATANLFGPTNNMTNAFNNARGAAGQAATAVGSTRGGSIASLGGALSGLAGFLGPAIFGAALSVAFAGLNKLEDSHRDAATAANAQADALDRVKSSLDGVSGAVGAAAISQGTKTLQSLPIPGLGNRNALDDIARTGIGTANDLVAATIPANQAQADDLMGKLVSGAAAKIAADPSYTDFRDKWMAAGVTPETLARAALGDPNAMDAVGAAESKAFKAGKPRKDWNQVERAITPNADSILPSVTDVIDRAGIHDYVGAGVGLTNVRDANVTGAAAIQQANRAQNQGMLNPAAAAEFAQFGTNDSKVFIDPENPNVATINTDRQPVIDPAFGSVVQLNPGQWQIQLTEEGTQKYVQKFASGGVIGGKGTGTSDSNLLLGSRGEFVTRKAAVDHYGQGFFHQLNSMSLPQGLSVGGPIPLKPPPVIPAPSPVVPSLLDTGAGAYRPGINSSGATMDAANRPGEFNRNSFQSAGQAQAARRGIDTAAKAAAYDPGGNALSALGRTLIGEDTYTMRVTTADSAYNALGSPAAESRRRPLDGRPAKKFTDPNAPKTLGEFQSELLGVPISGGATPPAARTGIPPYKSGVGGGFFDPVTGAAVQGPNLNPANPYAPVGGVAAPAAPSSKPTVVTTTPAVTGAQPATVNHGSSNSELAGPGPAVTGAALAAASAPGNAIGRSGSGLTPEAAQQLGMVGYGLPVGTNIAYGQGGFPSWVYQLGGRFNLQASTYPGHQEGAGLNQGLDFSGSPQEMRAFAEYMMTVPGVEQVIFQDPRDGTRIGRDPGDRQPGQSIEDYYAAVWDQHANHVHIRTSQSLPLPEQLAAMGLALPGLPAGIDLGGGIGQILGQASGAAGLTPDQFNGAGGGKKLNFFENIAAYFKGQSWLDPKKATEFLNGQANNVGSQLFSIGSQFLSGFTGLDFSSMVGYGQQVGGFLMDQGDGEDSAAAGGGSGLNGAAGASIDRYLNGQLSLGQSGGLDGILGGGAGGAGFNPAGGAEQWRPVVRKALAAYGPSYGITNLRAWEDALVKQIDSESTGNPGADNPTDSNGQGGTQHVSGLLQFLPETFAANNISGGSYLDPVAQIAAAIPYVFNKYGMNSDGSPSHIGLGKGFANGGLIKRLARGGKMGGRGGSKSDSNLVRVSRGEFLNSSAAVSHYGSDFFSRLNNRQVPKDSLPGFAGGMLWPMNSPIPLPAPAPAPMPVPPPAPMPAPAAPQPDGQSAGPLPMPQGAVGAAVDTAPSTGGAPGSGATAPAPDPGALPSVGDALSGLSEAAGGMGAGGTQPGAAPSDGADPRANLGAAPTSGEHTNPALKGAISGAASTIGSLAATAASIGAAAGTAGAGAAMPGAGSAASAGIQAGAQMAGAAVNGAVNVLSSLLVGTATNGSTASASGVSLLPQRQPTQTGVPAAQQGGRIHNGDVHITNMDEYRRTQDRMDAQASMPFIGKY